MTANRNTLTSLKVYFIHFVTPHDITFPHEQFSIISNYFPYIFNEQKKPLNKHENK